MLHRRSSKTHEEDYDVKEKHPNSPTNNQSETLDIKSNETVLHDSHHMSSSPLSSSHNSNNNDVDKNGEPTKKHSQTKRQKNSKKMSHTSKIFYVMILCYLLVLCFSLGLHNMTTNDDGDPRRQLRFHRVSNDRDDGSFRRRRTAAGAAEIPIRLSLSEEDDSKNGSTGGFRHARVAAFRYNETADYGGLRWHRVADWAVGRKIEREARDGKGHIYGKDDWKDEKWFDNYYAFDDDTVSHLPLSCRRVSWHFLYSPTCNDFHEETILRYKHVSHGAYRDVWLRHENESNKTFVFKTTRMKLALKQELFESIRMDALVMERLSSSPRIVDIYGHCGGAVITEALDLDIEDQMVPGDGLLKKDDPEGDGVPRNHFSLRSKLNIALRMAESLADLHGFKDGVIVHDDVQPSQWLLTSDGKTMKLNDFNRAEIMLYDDESQKYCKYTNGGVYGNYRAPEEVDDRDLDEKIDVFSFGNNVYCLLTGLWNFYEVADDEVVHEKLSKRELPHINDVYRTRSYAEKALVEILERCWVYEPEKRASIFEVVEFLTNAIEENARLEAMGKII